MQLSRLGHCSGELQLDAAGVQCKMLLTSVAQRRLVSFSRLVARSHLQVVLSVIKMFKVVYMQILDMGHV